MTKKEIKKVRDALKAKVDSAYAKALEMKEDYQDDVDAVKAAIDEWKPTPGTGTPMAFREFMTRVFEAARDVGVRHTARDRRHILRTDLDRMHRVVSGQLSDVDLKEAYDAAKAIDDPNPCLGCGVSLTIKSYLEAAAEAACQSGKTIDLVEVHRRMGRRYADYVRSLMKDKEVLSQEEDDAYFFDRYLTKEEYAARQEICQTCEFLSGSRCKKFCSCSGDLHESRRRNVKCPIDKW